MLSTECFFVCSLQKGCYISSDLQNLILKKQGFKRIVDNCEAKNKNKKKSATFDPLFSCTPHTIKTFKFKNLVIRANSTASS